MLEKQQVISFLKILQISADQPPAAIEQALIHAGWNENDAAEAVRVLTPAPISKEVSTAPQTIATVTLTEATSLVPASGSDTVSVSPPPIPVNPSQALHVEPITVRNIYHTGQPLSPATIHNLFGIDVQLDKTNLPESKQSRRQGATAGQLLLIISLSVIVSLITLVWSMYYFKVGPFHPSVINEQPWVNW